jgi:hypothetical protein
MIRGRRGRIGFFVIRVFQGVIASCLRKTPDCIASQRQSRRAARAQRASREVNDQTYRVQFACNAVS